MADQSGDPTPIIGAIVGAFTALTGAWVAWRKTHSDQAKAQVDAAKVQADAEVRRMEHRTNADNALRDDLLGRIKDLEARIDALQSQLNDVTLSRQDLVAQVATLTSEPDAARRARDEVTHERDELRASLHAYIEDNKELRVRNARLSTEVLTLRDNSDQLATLQFDAPGDT
jgi:chromosome segregation ATPase